MKKYPEICLTGEEIVDFSIYDCSTTFGSNDSIGMQYGGARYGTVVVNAVMEVDAFHKLGFESADIDDWNNAINQNFAYPEETKQYLQAHFNLGGDHIIFPIITYGYNNYCIPMIESDSFERDDIDNDVKEYMRMVYKSGREDVDYAMLITDYSFSPFANSRDESKFFADHLKEFILLGLQQRCDCIGIEIEIGDYLAQYLAAIGFKKLSPTCSVYSALMDDDGND